jgi:hypothetical protein
LGGGLQGDGVAELFELMDEAAGAVFGGAVALCPSPPEVAAKYAHIRAALGRSMIPVRSRMPGWCTRA